ncbi:BlaI/MecI/CopY family transcriptional regulator [Oryzihumus leptocrescens]|uniref:Putative transcriptional regulator n=1 Tax=Oryzihumus leptocrescens TaxID=297536 RepID=A0A542Z8W2_9MICO|nr:BlaI/MecI/CopY family transcriptional regulator [Oryzihumus leptocrescens]TQL56784.1 putative transcriptional regulator [Oryzihumus leptocrescens]
MATDPTPRLGELERAVMEHLWTRTGNGDGPATVREVHDVVGAERDLAYTTLMTVLDRLTRKGVVERERDGRAWRYAPLGSREQLTARTLRDALGGLGADDRRAAMVHFLDEASADEIADLRAALAALEARRDAPPA